MPPPYVRTIREELLYEYAKLISRSAYGSLQRGFITDRFKKLRDGEITISGTMREWEREQKPFHLAASHRQMKKNTSQRPLRLCGENIMRKMWITEGMRTLGEGKRAYVLLFREHIAICELK